MQVYAASAVAAQVCVSGARRQRSCEVFKVIVVSACADEYSVDSRTLSGSLSGLDPGSSVADIYMCLGCFGGQDFSACSA